MDFKKYPKIVNHYEIKKISNWVQGHREMETMPFLITEKLHGANIQLRFFPLESKNENLKIPKIEVGKRTRFLETNENFFGVWNALRDIESEIYTLVDIATANNYSFTLYGELLGMQKGVNYGSKNRILFFDMLRYDQFLSQEVFGSFMRFHSLGHLCVPDYGIVDGIQAALAYDTRRLSLAGPLSPYGGVRNECEGVVIKPWNTVLKDSRDLAGHFMIKKKNKTFSEKQNAKPYQVVLPERLSLLRSKFSELINIQRVESVFSKHGVIKKEEDIGKYVDLVLLDAKLDFDYLKELESLSKNGQKRVTIASRDIGKMLVAELDKNTK